ncbi:Uncharacterized protein TCM_021571 [Theobroma cacao]|uniref:Uncharacterized protein n=1 Tax=Theobroma cacao TaxID=3641 RepID=A0A061EQA4_THECC|nr:Uncharacterized protein TCM_021571 [Theobroma cacao]
MPPIGEPTVGESRPLGSSSRQLERADRWGATIVGWGKPIVRGTTPPVGESKPSGSSSRWLGKADRWVVAGGLVERRERIWVVKRENGEGK